MCRKQEGFDVNFHFLVSSMQSLGYGKPSDFYLTYLTDHLTIHLTYLTKS